MRRLSVVGLAGAAFAAAATPASAANDVWMWACHGPAGHGLRTGSLFDATGALAAPFRGGASGDAELVAFGGACATDGAGAGGLTGQLADGPAAAANAEADVDVPPGVTLTEVTLTRATHGFTGEAQPGNPQQYVARTAAGPLESLAVGALAELAGSATFPVTSSANSGDAVRLRVECPYNGGRCPGGPVSFDVSRVGLHVTDVGDPSAAVNWRNRAAGDLTVDVQATDAGTGLWSAQLLVDGVPADTQTFGGANCRELTPGDGTIDLPRDADCPHVASARLTLHTAAYGDGDHQLVARVLDAAGRKWEASETLSVENHVIPGQRSQTLTVGSAVPGESGSSGGGSSGGVAGASATACRSPKLSMFLNQKPLRVSHRVPVLKRNKTYRFKGRLTCVVRHRRVSGPRHARIDLINVVGRKTIEKNGTTVRAAGRITLILKYRFTRTLIFRFVNADGRRTQVRIRIKVAVK